MENFWINNSIRVKPLVLMGVLTCMHAALGSSAQNGSFWAEIIAATCITREEAEIIYDRCPIRRGYDPDYNGLLSGDSTNVSKFLLFKRSTDALKNKKAAIDRARNTTPNFDTAIDDEHQQELIKALDSVMEAEEKAIEKGKKLFYAPAQDKKALLKQNLFMKNLTFYVPSTLEEKEIIEREYSLLINVYKQGFSQLKVELLAANQGDYYDPTNLPFLKY